MQVLDNLDIMAKKPTIFREYKVIIREPLQVSRIKTYRVGRQRDCDLQLDDSTVSRRHAEVVLSPDGRYYLTDCNSAGGTFVRKEGQWQAVRQAFVSGSDQIRLGDFEMSASRFEALRQQGSGAGHSGGHGHTPAPGPDPRNRLIRDPVTGEVIEQR